MKAWVIHRICEVTDGAPLELRDIPRPTPVSGEVLLQVEVCGICHTELDEIEGRSAPPALPIIPGHQVVGRVVAMGENVTTAQIGDRVGVAWIFSACGVCPQCLSGAENLCPRYLATGRDRDGGYAEFMRVAAAFVHHIPSSMSAATAAPLLCAGAVGYRSYRLCRPHDKMVLGLTGFGASAHLVLQLAKFKFPDSKIFVFARSKSQREFAKDLGASWVGDTEAIPPEKLDAVIDTTPAWKPIVAAMEHLLPGGRLVINAIRKEDGDKACLLDLDYERHLWEEKEMKSVANVTRRDVTEFLELAVQMGIQPKIREYAFADANQALADLRSGNSNGAKVLRVS